VIVITDEVYEHLTFGEPHIPVATLPGAAWQRSSVNIGAGGMVPLVHLRRRERTLAA